MAKASYLSNVVKSQPPAGDFAGQKFGTDDLFGLQSFSGFISHGGDTEILLSLDCVLHGIQVLAKNLVHGKHVNLVLLEHTPHRSITTYLSLVLWILKVVLFDIFPYLFNGLRAGECAFTK
jgi:hypothetical protein